MQSIFASEIMNTEEGVAEKAMLGVEGIADMTNYKRGLAFYMVFTANLVVDLLSALDLVWRELSFSWTRTCNIKWSNL